MNVWWETWQKHAWLGNRLFSVHHFTTRLLGSDAVGGGGRPLRSRSSTYDIKICWRSSETHSNTRWRWSFCNNINSNCYYGHKVDKRLATKQWCTVIYCISNGKELTRTQHFGSFLQSFCKFQATFDNIDSHQLSPSTPSPFPIHNFLHNVVFNLDEILAVGLHDRQYPQILCGRVVTVTTTHTRGFESQSKP